MTTKILLYNKACRNLGEERLASVSEDRPIRHELDAVYDDDDFLDAVLEEGFWNFAVRTIESTYNNSIDPDFGLQRVHDKPSDWVNTVELSADEYFTEPLLHYEDEVDKWYTEHDTIYVRYISNDGSYGGDLTQWPETFATFVGWYLAKEIAPAVIGRDNRLLLNEIRRSYYKARSEARSNDALNQPTAFPPRGTWSNARSGRANNRRDRGKTGSLTG